MELLFCLLFICAHNFALANVNWHTTGCVKLHYFFFLFCFVVLVFQTDMLHLSEMVIDLDFVVSLKLRTTIFFFV